ncbi:hypothetical protein CLAFUW4_14243 [Fulvia fulva]|uniref:Piwi domain-containing protein n=1 Tax=Passalora fulva TaxID=5499 RepID=A0A9Q8UWP1_PASFU|nr:uncharacterized protein CLAFUR5_14076 [Fulvia fulva]UJO25254.1 hypothetical protein CLAFUR5_14076 [Fulvia fulva]WPV22967.1 hypothetical protein CLAFUW4_14243 [Fulvia fulva]
MSSQEDNDQANKLTKESTEQKKDGKNDDKQKGVLPRCSASLPFRPQAPSSGPSQTQSAQPTVPPTAASASAANPSSSTGATPTMSTATAQRPPRRDFVPPHLKGIPIQGPVSQSINAPGGAHLTAVGPQSVPTSGGSPAPMATTSHGANAIITTSSSGGNHPTLSSPQVAAASSDSAAPLISATGSTFQPSSGNAGSTDPSEANTTAIASSTSSSALPASSGLTQIATAPSSARLARVSATGKTYIPLHARKGTNATATVPVAPHPGTSSTTVPSISQSLSSDVQNPSAGEAASNITKSSSSTLIEDQSSKVQPSTTAVTPSAVIVAGQPSNTKSIKTQKPPRPTFFDAKYAAAAASAQKPMNNVPLRVNQFEIDNSSLGEIFYVYTVSLPQVSGRDVTNIAVKKIMMAAILSPVQPWAAAVARQELFSDYINTVITRKPLSELSGGALTLNDAGEIRTSIDFQNQALNTMDTNRPVLIKLSQTLLLPELLAYCAGQQPSNFNFSEYTKAANILVRHFATTAQVSVGQNRIFPRGNQPRLNSGLLPRIGFFNSVRPFNGSVRLQLNTSAAGFYSDKNLLDFLDAFIIGFDPNDERSIHKSWPEVWGAIKGLKVRLLYTPPDLDSTTAAPRPKIAAAQGRLKTICGYGEAVDAQIFQDRRTGGHPTVKHYFEASVINFPLQHPKLRVVNVGDDERKVWVPMELLSIEAHQAFSSPLQQRDMDKMAKLSCTDPGTNVQRIQEIGLPLLGRPALETNNVLTISPLMSEVKGRILPVPAIRYHVPVLPNDKVSTAKGKWNLANKSFHTGSTLGRLQVIQAGNTPGVSKDACDAFVEELNRLGVTTTLGNWRRAATASDEDLFEAYKGNDGKIVLVIVPDTSAEVYAQVKAWGELRAGVHTVCVTYGKSLKLEKDLGFQSNLALKFNAKLGGKNHVLVDNLTKWLPKSADTKGGQTMVLGADVAHPGPASLRFCPSIAAVVASIDHQCITFPGSMRLQASRQEQIADIKQMVQERLQAWYDHKANMKTLPTRLLFYRDGVSEDQFSMVVKKEFPHIERACQDVAQANNVNGYKPQITLVVCTKRHQTRFYQPAKISDPEKRFFLPSGNAKPGLLVDDPSVRLPNHFDFYLQAHNALKGTAKPCHYFVLKNDMNLTTHQLQMITNSLSWVYATSLTPISMAAPAYYADKLCERGRCYIRPLLLGSHPKRPNIDDVMQGAPQGANEDAKKGHVVQYFTGHQEFWPGDGANPCATDVKDTMFYI